MENVKFQLVLENDNQDAADLNSFIREQNVKGLLSKVEMKDPEPGTQSGMDYSSIITLVLQSTVVAAGVKGLFDVIKNYFDLKKQGLVSEADGKKAEHEANKIKLKHTTKDGRNLEVELSAFTEQERQQFLTFIQSTASN
jgi:hypothetical protein